MQPISRRQFVRYGAAGAAAAYLQGCASAPPPVTSGSAPADAGDLLAEIALKEIRKSGAEYGDFRALKTWRQSVRGQDRRISGVRDSFSGGYGVRVLYRGAWGFAASCDMRPAEVRRVARLAIEIAKESSVLTNDPVKLAPEPVHKDHVVTARRIDPFTVPLEQKTALLLEAMEIMQKVEGIKRSRGSVCTGITADPTWIAFQRAAVVREYLIENLNFHPERVEARAWLVEIEDDPRMTDVVDARLIHAPRTDKKSAGK